MKNKDSMQEVKTQGAAITFSTVIAEHESIILNWLQKPHVREWFHGEGLQNTINGLRKFIENKTTSTKLWIAFFDGEPFAYLITSSVDAEKEKSANSHFSKWVEADKKMNTLDLLIGEEKYLGKGLASRLIQEFISTMLKDSDIIFIDPEATNRKAIHVYEKVGFEKIDQFIASWHPVPHFLMILKRNNHVK